MMVQYDAERMWNIEFKRKQESYLGPSFAKKKMTHTAAIFTVCSINFWSLYKILENLMTSNDQINLGFLI